MSMHCVILFFLVQTYIIHMCVNMYVCKCTNTLENAFLIDMLGSMWYYIHVGFPLSAGHLQLESLVHPSLVHIHPLLCVIMHEMDDILHDISASDEHLEKVCLHQGHPK